MMRRSRFHLSGYLFHLNDYFPRLVCPFVETMAKRPVNDCLLFKNTSLNKEEDHNNSEQTRKKWL